MHTTDFADRLKILRKNKKLTQVQLAKILDVDQSLISYYEKKKKVPELKMLYKIASYFDVSIDYLLGSKEGSTSILSEVQLVIVYFNNNEKLAFSLDTFNLIKNELQGIKFYECWLDKREAKKHHSWIT